MYIKNLLCKIALSNHLPRVNEFPYLHGMKKKYSLQAKISCDIPYIRGFFCDDFIFAFFAITFIIAKYIQYAESISSIVCYKKLFKSQYMTDENKKVHISPILAIFVSCEKNQTPDLRYYVTVKVLETGVRSQAQSLLRCR